MRKKYSFLFSFLFSISSFCQATTYYVKANGGNKTSGLSDADAWNYATLNSKRLAPGDVVLLKRGDTFFGELKVQAGKASKPITYGAYGSGANPVITGFASINSWTRYSGSIYYVDLSAYKLSTLNLVSLNGAVKGMGRYPNSGYLSYTGHTGNTSITGTTIGSLPFNATGAEAVIRKVRWILDRHPVNTHAGNTLRLGSTSRYGGSLSYEAVDKNGFFIQNHLNTLDQQGEWYYDISAKRLYMVLPNASSAVKVSVVDKLVSVSSKSYISFTDIDFTGSNTHGVSMQSANTVRFTRCNFDQHGQTAIYGNNVSNVTISGGSISNCLNSGIWVEWAGNNVTVDGVSVNNIGTIAGAGRSGDGAQQGIAVSGNNTTITNCRVTNIGYNGIQFNGNNAKIENNYVDTFCTVKDDGGGIYTYENDGVTVANRVVRNNIVLNAIGVFAGAESYYYEAHGKAAGVYLDGNSNHTTVSNNVLAHGAWAGVFVNNNSSNQILDNLIYNHAASVFLTTSKAGKIRNMTITGNKCVARLASQEAVYIQMYAADNPASMGTFNNNFYARPVDDNKTLHCDFSQPDGAGAQHYTLEQWKAAFRLDASSKKSPLTFKGKIEDSLRFEYNDANEVKTVSLDAAYIDVQGTAYAKTFTLQPFSGVVLFKNKTGLAAPGKAIQTINFPALPDKMLDDAPFTLNATASSGLAVSYRVVSGPATVSGNTVTITDVGTVTIEASQAGNASYNAASSVQQSFSVLRAAPQTVAAAAQTISFGTLPYKTYGSEPFQLNATSSSGLPVSYRILSGPATISGNTVTITGVGTVTIEASQAGNATYSPADLVQRSFTVGKASQAITFPEIENKSAGDAPFTLAATSSSGLPVSYRVVSGPATVSGNKVTIKGSGRVTIEASQNGNAYYYAAYPPQRSFTVNNSKSKQFATTSVSAESTTPLEMKSSLDVKSSLAVYPNPVVSSAAVRVVLNQTLTGNVDVLDMQGRVVLRLGSRRFEQEQPATLALDGSKLPPGMYIVRLSWEGGMVSQQFIVGR
jgi:hypothetical protein